MNILFLTISRIDSILTPGIYTDLMRKFLKEGHNIYIVSPIERQFKRPTCYLNKEGVQLLKVKTLNLQKTNFIEKGVGTILLEYQFLSAIRKYLKDINFDLVLYSTPPITFSKVIKWIKKNSKAKSYLLLKDIFPQNAVDLQLIKKNTLLYRYFRRKEKKLYKISDIIGCMSPANVEYVKRHNPILTRNKIEICPNSIEIKDNFEYTETQNIRFKYSIPQKAILFLYGGNLGKPQGLDFLKDVLDTNNNKPDRFFLIVGSGTEYSKIEKWFNIYKYSNALLLSSLSPENFHLLAKNSDVGLILLDKRFTIPNFPSRILSYLQNKLPIIAATDINTDIGNIAEDNKFGFWCLHGDIYSFNNIVEYFCHESNLRKEMGINGYNYLLNNYTVEHSAKIILKHLYE